MLLITVQRLSSGGLQLRFCAHSVALISQSNAGNTQPFVSPQKQTVLLFSQRTEAKNELMSHRSEDLKENTALILSALPSLDALWWRSYHRLERCGSQYPSAKSSPLLWPNLMSVADLYMAVSERAARICNHFTTLARKQKASVINQLHLIAILRSAFRVCYHPIASGTNPDVTPTEEQSGPPLMNLELPTDQSSSDSTIPKRSPSASSTTLSNVTGCGQTSLNAPVFPSHTLYFIAHACQFSQSADFSRWFLLWL